MPYKSFFFLFLYLCLSSAVFSAPAKDSLLHELSQVIKKRDFFVREKQERIRLLQEEFKKEGLSLVEQYNAQKNLFKEYQTFKYDSAFSCAIKLHEIAGQLNDPARITYAKLKLSFVMLSSGMFKETFDSLNTIKLAHVPDSIKMEYYSLKSRAFNDLAEYNSDFYFTNGYREQGRAYRDSALALSDKNSFQFFYLSAMKDDMEEAKKSLQLILDKLDLSYSDYAITASTLAAFSRITGEKDRSTDLMIKAAIADVKSATKEAVALMILADLLYEAGDEVRAYAFIKHAMEDAEFYGARQRKLQVAAILPIIEGGRLTTVEGQRERAFIFAVVVSFLSLLLIAFAFIIFKQVKQLRKAKRIVTEANNKLAQANDKLQETNLMLQEANGKYQEANKIKEEYVGYSFNMYHEYIQKLENIKQAINKKLKSKKYEDISQVISSVDLKNERQNLHQSFDKIFLTLFPNFIPAFNSYFKDEDRFVLHENQLLSNELRIFALIRIGIKDHEQIAKIMEYSIRTIYNYKTKVKNKALISNEAFEQKIMEVRAF